MKCFFRNGRMRDNSVFFRAKRALEDGCGKLCRATGAEHVRLGAGHYRISPAVEVFRLRFHNLKNFQNLRDVSRESFVFHIFNFQILREVSHESFVFHTFHSHFFREISREIRFSQWAAARNCVFCGPKRASKDGRGSFAACAQQRGPTAKRSHSSKDVSQQRELTASLTAKGSHRKEIS